MSTETILKPVPGFSKYRIDNRGNGINVVTGESIIWHKSNDYIFTIAVDDNGFRSSEGQHRMVALAWVPMPETDEKLIINHRDGDKSNNFYKNLEWSTYSHNLRHAFSTGLRTDRVPVIVTHIPTNEVRQYFSKNECCRQLGWPTDKLLRLFKDKKGGIYGDYKFEFLIEESTWSNVNPYPIGVVARNIKSGEFIISDTVEELSRYVNVGPKIIRKYLTRNYFQYPINGFDFRVNSDKVNWPTYTPEEVNAFHDVKFIHCPVFVTKDDVSLLLGSIKKAAIHTGTSERTIRTILKCGGNCPKGFTYKKYERERIANV